MLYFAYGSNMNLEAMRKRCPLAKLLGPRELKAYKLAYRGPMGRVYLTLLPAADSCVQGLLFDVPASDWQALDDYEDYPELYDKEELILDTGEKALVYLMVPAYMKKLHYQPHPDYVAECMTATKTAGLATTNLIAAARELEAAATIAFKLDQVSFSYSYDEAEQPVQAEQQAGDAQSNETNFVRPWTLRDINLAINDGEYICIVGRNGSGKSTLIRHLNALLLPQEGQVTVYGIDSKSEEELFELRRQAGMVFQNPDNQIIGTTVTEDMAFGPENLGIPPHEIRQRIKAVLQLLHLEDFADREPSRLSGGQKQKVAIAGILAMNPRAILLDEATSMLDPLMREEFLDFLDQLRRSAHLTVVHVTHHFAELVRAQRVLLLDKGAELACLSPQELFMNKQLLAKLQVDLPDNYALWQFFKELKGEEKSSLAPFNEETVSNDLIRLISNVTAADLAKMQKMMQALAAKESTLVKAAESKLAKLSQLWPPTSTELPEEIVQVENLSHTYASGNHKQAALNNISFSVKKGEILAIVGPTGSGKSTLIMHLNALLAAQSGKVQVAGLDVGDKSKRQSVRRRLAMLFQYPEQQLFAETVAKDIAFGPEKLGYTPEQVTDLVHLSCELVGIDKEILSKSPFELSGGQMRRVALAGIIAMQAEVFVLDEPAAGLDDIGRREVFSYIKLLQQLGKTIIVVSHNMEDVARYADRMLIMQNGTLQALAAPETIFSQTENLEKYALQAPVLVRTLKTIADALKWPIPLYAANLSKALEIIYRHLSKLQMEDAERSR